MTELWGAVAGMQAGDENNRQNAIVQMKKAAFPLEQQSARLTLEEQGLKIQQAQMALEHQKKFMELMQAEPQGGAAGKPDDGSGVIDPLAAEMDRMGKAALGAGMPEQAKDYFTSASTMRKNQAEISEKASKAHADELTLVSNLLSNTHDQASWDQGNHIYEMEMGKPSPVAHLPYSPQLVESLKLGHMNAKDQALTAAAEARAKASLATAAEGKARLELISSQNKLALARAAAVAKAGGKAVLPTAEDLRAVTDLVTHDHEDLLPADARMYARPVADRMLELMRTNSLSRSDAAKQAYNEFKQNGHFEGIPNTRYEPGSERKPMDLAKGTKIGDLKPNMYYKNSKGQVALWNGRAFEPPKKPVGDDEVTDEEDDQ